jgi:RNA polymerase primary sigma factor
MITNNRQILNQYLKEIRYDLLTPEDEEKLSKIICNSDCNSIEYHDAVFKLVIHNLRFAVKIAKKYENNGLVLNDLINEANLGLIKAAQKYNYEKSRCRFITYAVWWIRQSILFAIASDTRTVKLPYNIISRYTEYKKIINRMIAKDGKYENDEIAKEMQLPIDDIYKLEKYMIRNCSFDEPVSNDDDGIKTRLDAYKPESSTDKYDKEYIKCKLNAALNLLDDRSKNIIKDYYGIDIEYPIYKEDLAKKYNVTSATINNIINESELMLKFLLKNKIIL